MYEKKKRGRPKKEGGRKNQVKILLTDDELKRLRLLSGRSGISQSDIIRNNFIQSLDNLERRYPGPIIRPLEDDEYLFEECMYLDEDVDMEDLR